MRKLCATVLTVTFCWQPLSAAALDDPRGPLARSTAREAARVAALPADEFDTPGWGAVRALDPGKDIIITTADATIRGSFVSADSGTLTLREGDTTRQVRADDVLVVGNRSRRGSAAAAVLGTLGGIWLGSALALNLAFNVRCQPDCGAVELGMWGSIIGIPVAGGYGAWRASSRLTEEIIYRRPPTARP